MFKRFFKTEPDDSGSVDVLKSCMDDIAAELKTAFETQYGWGADEKEKRLESMLLSKFLVDHALISTFCDRISKKRLKNLNTILDTIFEAALKKIAPETPAEEYLDRFREYSIMLRNNSSPRCWQLIAGSCLGIDLVEEAPTVQKFPKFLPELFIKARETLKQIIK